MNLYQNTGKRRLWRRKGRARSHHIGHTWRRQCYGVQDAVGETGSLVFIYNGTTGRCSRMNSELYRAVLSAHIQSNSAKLQKCTSVFRRMTQKRTANQSKSFLRQRNWMFLNGEWAYFFTYCFVFMGVVLIKLTRHLLTPYITLNHLIDCYTPSARSFKFVQMVFTPKLCLSF